MNNIPLPTIPIVFYRVQIYLAQALNPELACGAIEITLEELQSIKLGEDEYEACKRLINLPDYITKELFGGLFITIAGLDKAFYEGSPLDSLSVSGFYIEQCYSKYNFSR